MGRKSLHIPLCCYSFWANRNVLAPTRECVPIRHECLHGLHCGLFSLLRFSQSWVRIASDGCLHLQSIAVHCRLVDTLGTSVRRSSPLVCALALSRILCRQHSLP